MTTGLERIASKAKQEPKLRFTSLTHHVTKDDIWKSLIHMPKDTAAGVDGITIEEAESTFDIWSEDIIKAVHHKGYQPPPVRRVWIPKPGKTEKRPIGIPCVADRALQRSVSKVLEAIYEQDFLDCSFGGRPKRGAHNALATFNEVVAGKKVSWVLEADLKNFFGSLDHEWMKKFVEHRVGDPRILTLIRRWMKAGVIEEGKWESSEVGTPQGGSISVLLSNVYLHYVLDLWFEKIVKPRLKGEAYLIRYIDDFVVCFQYRSDANQFHGALEKRLQKFALQLEPDKTELVEFGRYAGRHAKKFGRKLETVYFLGFTHYCTVNRKGNFQVGRKTEKTRFKRSITKLQEEMQRIRHWPVQEQIIRINQMLAGHYNYYGLGGNYPALAKVYDKVKVYWRKMLSSRSTKSSLTWVKYQSLLGKFPILRPKLSLSYPAMQRCAVMM